MLELRLRHLGYTYCVYQQFTKHCERVQTFRETSLKYLYRNELDKACFAHNAVNSDSKDLAKKTTSDKTLKDRANEFAINPIYNACQRDLANMFYKFFDKKAE